jgi:ABC-type bacteriocin/lantibiotic exporter with double-glycine peptidase domain
MAYPEIAPNIAQWSIRRHHDVLEQLRGYGRPGVITLIGIDGHSGSGKSTLADGLAGLADDVCAIHTDDLAWHHSFFDWGQVLA